MDPNAKGKGTVLKRKINFGVIGCGEWGKSHALVFDQSPYANLVAVCDLNVDAARNVAQRHSVNYYTDYNKMFDTESIDAVGIATPDFAHGDPLLAAISRGLDILCEKPLTTDPDELDRILEALNRNKVRIMVDYHNRWNPVFSQAKQTVLDGVVGRPITAYMRLNDKIFVPQTYLKWAQQSSIIWFLGSHTVDTLMWMFDDRITRVYSVATSGLLQSLGLDAVDMYLSTVEFEKGGIGQMENGWITPDSTPSINDFKFSMVGSSGMIDVDLSSSGCFQVFGAAGVEQPDFFVKNSVHGKPKGFAFEAMSDFVEKLYFDQDFVVAFEDSVYVNRVLFAILESAVKREPVVVK